MSTRTNLLLYRLFPFNVPHGTPVIILHIALQYRLMNCDCVGCRYLLHVGPAQWFTGYAVRTVPIPLLARLDTRHRFTGATSPPTLVSTVDLRTLPAVKWLMQFLPIDYLLTTLSIQNDDSSAYPMIQHVFDLNVKWQLDLASPTINGKITPLKDNELRFRDTRLRFLWSDEEDEVSSGGMKRKREI